MQNFSLAPGSSIRVIRNDSRGLIIGSGKRRLALDRSIAGRIWVGNLCPDAAAICRE